MKKWVIGLVMAMAIVPAVWAGNIQGQQQGQLQGQLQGQGQQQDQDTDTNVSTGEDENVYRGSFAASIPEGNEGPAVFTPWGGVGISKMSRVTELLMMAEVVKENSPEHLWIIEQLKDEIGESCRWLGFGPKGWQFPFLLGLDCWPDLRVWED